MPVISAHWEDEAGGFRICTHPVQFSAIARPCVKMRNKLTNEGLQMWLSVKALDFSVLQKREEEEEQEEEQLRFKTGPSP